MAYASGSQGLVSEVGTSASLRGLVGLGLSSDQSFLVGVNEYILSRHYPMPNGIHELHKLSGFRINVEVGVANAYHQLRLSRKTSAMLSVQSVFVQFEPACMPEGVGPAMSFLQEMVRNVLGEFDEWMVIIFDNLLICASTYQEAWERLEKVLYKCLKYNVFSLRSPILGFWLCFPWAVFVLISHTVDW